MESRTTKNLKDINCNSLDKHPAAGIMAWILCFEWGAGGTGRASNLLKKTRDFVASPFYRGGGGGEWRGWGVRRKNQIAMLLAAGSQFVQYLCLSELGGGGGWGKLGLSYRHQGPPLPLGVRVMRRTWGSDCLQGKTLFGVQYNSLLFEI